jgi:hypothetical protein
MSGDDLAVAIVRGLVSTILDAHAAAGERAREAMDVQIARLHARPQRSLSDAVRTSEIEAHAEIERRRAEVPRDASGNYVPRGPDDVRAIHDAAMARPPAPAIPREVIDAIATTPAQRLDPNK